MATVPDPPTRTRPCPHCGGRAFQTFGHSADATLYCMNPACGRPLEGPAPPWFPATDPAACRLCTRRRATHMVRTDWGPSGRCDSCYAAYHALRRRQRARADAALDLDDAPAAEAPAAGSAAPAPPQRHGAGGRRHALSEAAFAHTAPGVFCAYVAAHDGKPPTTTQLATRLSEHFDIHPTVQVRIIERRIQTYRQQGGRWPPDCPHCVDHWKPGTLKAAYAALGCIRRRAEPVGR